MLLCCYFKIWNKTSAGTKQIPVRAVTSQWWRRISISIEAKNNSKSKTKNLIAVIGGYPAII